MEPFAQLAAEIAAADAGAFWFWVSIGTIGALAAFYGAFRALRHARIIEDTPTAKTRSAAQGYCELNGHARLLPGPEIRSPLSQARCAWWRYKIERKETVWRDGKRRTEWRTIESGLSDALFLLCDDTGECVVDPAGAEVYPSLKRTWYGRTPRPIAVPERTRWWAAFGDYRYTEALVQVGDHLYALGQFRTQGGVQAANAQAEARDLLAEWKRDQKALLERFDANRDGKVDLDEWEAVRRAALDQVRTEHAARPVAPDVNVFSRTPDGRPYILSTLPQEQLTRRLRWSGVGLMVLSLALGAACVFALQARLLVDPPQETTAPLE